MPSCTVKSLALGTSLELEEKTSRLAKALVCAPPTPYCMLIAYSCPLHCMTGTSQLQQPALVTLDNTSRTSQRSEHSILRTLHVSVLSSASCATESQCAPGWELALYCNAFVLHTVFKAKAGQAFADFVTTRVTCVSHETQPAVHQQHAAHFVVQTTSPLACAGKQVVQAKTD